MLFIKICFVLDISKIVICEYFLFGNICLNLLNEILEATNNMNIDLDSIDDNKIVVTVDNATTEYNRKGLPPSMFDFLIDYRLRAIKVMRGEEEDTDNVSVTSSMLHSPPMATRGSPGFFPVNTAAKGIGFVPKDEYIEKWVEKFEVHINEAIENGPESNQDARFQALVDFYEAKNEISPKILGTIELFGFRSWRNMKYDPRISLLYNANYRTGSGRPQYISFEVRGIIEIIEKNTMRWRWQRNIHDLFHQRGAEDRRSGDWPVGVLTIHVTEVIDKRPFATASQEITE